MPTQAVSALSQKTKLAAPKQTILTVTKQPIVTKQLPKKDSAGIYSENGDYQKDIEINHMRNRYTLTKGAFQAMVGSTLCHASSTDIAHKPSKQLKNHTTCFVHRVSWGFLLSFSHMSTSPCRF
jgi:hypothetical protein